ncbi:MAG: V-type ATPase subunit [Thiohalophilus sp.]|uniref:V-type ATPase subunit n=1 Tax=Thiohalophilus sp. TaxID=3028392 RepID=UPI00287045FB|nr:V-type ATPase subunit [Thiohalophilus sp.]MDR9435788.1 V-type ATPase subunit [Thiohalophilus sp.]
MQAKHAYLNTRLNLLSGWMKRTDLNRQLIRKADARPDDLLSQAGLPQIFSGLLSQPDEFDRQLHQLFLHEVTLLLRATTGALREFVIQWLRQYELLNIKTVLRARAYGEPIDSTRITLLDIGGYASLSAETLLAAEDVNEIFRVLEHYNYAGLAQKARRNYQEQQNIFDLEAMIDRQYFVDLMQHFQFLDPAHKKALQPLLGMQLDRVNLLWLLRYRLNYGMDTSHIYYLLAPTGRWLDKAVLMTLLHQDTMEEMLQQLPPAWHKTVAGKQQLTRLENAADQLLQNYYMGLFRRSPDSVVRLVCYLWLRQHQLKQVAIIIKGRELGLESSMISDAAGLEDQDQAGSNPGGELNLARAG